MNRRIVKVCGMRDPANIRGVAELRPDFMGFIFYDQSPRYVGTSFDPPSTPGIKRVGVFVDEELAVILHKVETYHLNMVQLHGNEGEDLCKELQAEGIQVIKVVHVSRPEDVVRAQQLSYVDYILFDYPGGGTGKSFSWEWLSAYTGTIPFLIAGGISEGDVDRLLKIDHPLFLGVDINSRLETLPGLKDVSRVNSFIQSFRQ